MWVQTTDESKSGRMVFLWQQINIQRMWVRSDLCISIWGDDDDDEKSRIKDQISKIKDEGSRMKDRGSRRRIPSQLKCIPWHSPQKNKWDFFFDNCIIQLIMCGYYWAIFGSLFSYILPHPTCMSMSGVDAGRDNLIRARGSWSPSYNLYCSGWIEDQGSRIKD